MIEIEKAISRIKKIPSVWGLYQNSSDVVKLMILDGFLSEGDE